MKYSETEESGVSVYSLSGYLQGKPEGYAFLEKIRGKIAETDDRIVIDLDGVDRIDSSGIGVIATIVTSAEKNGAAIRLCNVKGRVHELLVMVGISKVVDCDLSREEAVRAILADEKG